jgi:cell division protein FtsZ
LGPHLTQGLGAGANPEIGRQATEESLEEIRRILEVNTKMAFITAGMGGGTGTGGAPIIAKICRDLGVLTVGIVTTPFGYEGKRRIQQAEDGISKLREYVDTLLVISNDKLRHQFGNLKMKEAFSKADNVLATAAKCITDVINTTGQINVDFADVCTVMKNGGVAILGNASASGENRAQRAIEEALNSPLLNDNDIRGAKWILININSAEGEHEFTMDEVETIQNYLIQQAGEGSDVILGMGYDNTLQDQISITLIATGFEQKNPFDKKPDVQVAAQPKEEKIVMVLGEQPEEKAAVKQTVLFTEPVADPVAPQLIVPQVEEPVVRPVESVETVRIDWVLSPELSSTPELSDEPKAPSAELPVADKGISTTVVSGGYLERPANIYVVSGEPKPVPEMKTEESAPVVPSLNIVQETEESFEMQLIEKSESAGQKEQDVTPDLKFQVSMNENNPIADEAEEQRRKAADRLQKLRNLSFNIHGSDSNNEFDSVPAYLRRNLELYNTISPAENFYSNYTVHNDENNQGPISTINTYLDGKKPD